MKKYTILFSLMLVSIVCSSQTLQQLQGKWSLTKMKTGEILIEPSKSDSLINAWTEEYKTGIVNEGEDFTAEDSLSNVEDSKSLLKSLSSLVYTFKAQNVMTMDVYSETEEKMIKQKGTYTYNAKTKVLTIKSKTKAGKTETKKYKVKINKSVLTLTDTSQELVITFKKG